MTFKTTGVAATVIALIGFASASQAAPAPSKPSPADARFMKMLAQGGIAEVQTGKLTLAKTRNTRVHNVATTIVADHTQANAALMQVAKKEGVTLPSQTDPTHKAIYAKLSTLQGNTYDRNYISGQVKDHDKTVALIQHEMSATNNALLLAFLKQTLPKIQMHTAELHQINASLRAGATGPVQNGLKHTASM